MPSGYNAFGEEFERMLPASSVANFFPFAYTGKTDPNGFYIGYNKYGSFIFTTAHDYLKGVMNGKTALPVKAWKAEYAKLTAERETLNRRYLALKGEVKEAEQIRKSVYNILRQEQREQQPRRAQDVER